MRYLVDLVVRIETVQTVSVEAATIGEAERSAVDTVRRANFENVTHSDIVAVREDPKPDHNELERGMGYISRIL